MIAVELICAGFDQLCGCEQIWLFQTKRKRGRYIGIRKHMGLGSVCGFYVLEIRLEPQIVAEVLHTEGREEATPAMCLCVVRSSQCDEAFDIGIVPFCMRISRKLGSDFA